MLTANQKVFPDISCKLYSGAIQPFPTSAPLLVNDVMSGSLLPGAGDSATGMAFNDVNPNLSGAWFAQPSYQSVDGLQFVRFCEDGTVKFGAKPIPGIGKSDWAGWALQPREAWLDAKIGDDGTITDGELTDQNFEAISGMWKTVLPLGQGHGTAIYNPHGTGVAVARTIGTIPANRSLCFDLHLLGQSSGSTQCFAGIRFGGQSGEYRLVWPDGQSIGLEKAIPTVAIEGNALTLSTQWNRILTLDDVPVASFRDARYRIYVYRISGRMVVVINGSAFWYLERGSAAAGPFDDSTTENGNLYDVSWGAGRIQLDSSNARCRLEFGVVKYSSSEGVPNTGTLSKLTGHLPMISDGPPTESYSGGWKKAGTSVSIVVSEDATSYSCTLTANVDGIDTPFLTKVALYKDVIWTQPSALPLECRGAVRSVRVNQSLPSTDNTTGNRANVELDIIALREICRAAGVGFLDYAVPFRRIEIKARWLRGDGSAVTDYIPLFRGVTTSFSEQLPAFGVHKRSLHCEDMTVLLDKPAGLIDHTDGPLDIYYCRKAGTALGSINQAPNEAGAALYGHECVREIVRHKLGSVAADAMEIYFPPSHYALMDVQRDRCGYIQLQSALGNQANYENGFLLPAPYGEHAMDWIRRFMQLDHGVFFTSFPQDRTQWPVLIYARLQHWLQQSERVTWQAPDNAYSSGDVDRMIEYLETETRADRDINHFISWSSPPNTDLGGLLPALRMSEAYLNSGNVAWRSWKRSLLIENDLAYIGGAGVAGVDALAQITRNDLEGVQMLWPGVSLPGEGRMAPGDKLTIRRELGQRVYGSANISAGDADKDYSSFAGLDGLATVTCRIEALEHNIDLSGGGSVRRWTTTPEVRPLTSSGV